MNASRMNASHRLRRVLIWVGGTLLGLAALVVVAAFALDAGYLRGPLLKLLRGAHGPANSRGRSPEITDLLPQSALGGRACDHRQPGVDSCRQDRGSGQSYGGLCHASPGPGTDRRSAAIDDATLHLFRDADRSRQLAAQESGPKRSACADRHPFAVHDGRACAARRCTKTPAIRRHDLRPRCESSRRASSLFTSKERDR